MLDLVARFAGDGVDAFVVTDIGRDGTLSGPDVGGLASVLAARTCRWWPAAAWGPRRPPGAGRPRRGGRRLAGAIVGTAIHDGRFTVGEALAALGR